MNKIFYISLCYILILFSTPNLPAIAADNYTLYSFTGTGTTWPGWTWANRTAPSPFLPTGYGSTGADGFGMPGWDFNNGSMLNGNWYPRSTSKEDTGNKSSAIMDPATLAPGASSGASMKVYDTYQGTTTTAATVSGTNVITVANPTGYQVGDNIWMPNVPAYNYPAEQWFPQISAINGNQFTIVRSDTQAAYSADATVSNSLVLPLYLSGWWFEPGNNLNYLSLADASTNRMSMYVNINGLNFTPGNNVGMPTTTFYMGTYLCWYDVATGSNPCPQETGNNHYYHYLTLNSGGWTHILFDQSPQHLRSEPGTPGPDPQFVADGVHHYFQNMNNFYLQVTYPQQQPTAFWIGGMNLYTTAEPENEVSVCTPFVSYWQSTNTWELGFNDNSWSNPGSTVSLGNSANSTHEIRYSTSPITNENYSSATPITPLVNAQTNANAGPGRILRPNSWENPTLTRFTLPIVVLQSTNDVYFAIKDVSSVANGDGHDAPSTLIKTIDFNMVMAAGTNSIRLGKSGIRVGKLPPGQQGIRVR